MELEVQLEVVGAILHALTPEPVNRCEQVRLERY